MITIFLFKISAVKPKNLLVKMILLLNWNFRTRNINCAHTLTPLYNFKMDKKVKCWENLSIVDQSSIIYCLSMMCAQLTYLSLMSYLGNLPNTIRVNLEVVRFYLLLILSRFAQNRFHWTFSKTYLELQCTVKGKNGFGL